MTRLLKNGSVINVFTGEIEQKNILMEDNLIIGVGDYTDADEIEDVTGCFLCPGFIDGHIHIESTMLLPSELAKVCVPHGTSALVCDPHEIANVLGTAGITYMIQASRNLPMDVYVMLPSCVPATGFDESATALFAKDLEPFYEEEAVLGLAEMMNYPGVLGKDPDVLEKIEQAKQKNKIINGHAPMLSGSGLDAYIANGIQDDHECSTFEEGVERVRKGQWVMIREGTSGRNLEGLIDLFDEPYRHRCVLVADDKHPYDLIQNGHIDAIIRRAVELGKSAVTGIRMATIQAAQCFGLRGVGAIAPGYVANVLVLRDLDTVDVKDVYFNGKKVVSDQKIISFDAPEIASEIKKKATQSFHMKTLTEADFMVEPKGEQCRIIQVSPGGLLTQELVETLDFKTSNGIDVSRDILKLAVVERHNDTGHIGLGYINGIGLKSGAIASSVSHDSHNLIVAGTNEKDMALAANAVAEMGGGLIVVKDGKVVSSLSLSIAGLMSEKSAEEVAKENEACRRAVHALGASEKIEPFMTTAFVSLSVIPAIKMTTHGLVDVNNQKLLPLFV